MHNIEQHEISEGTRNTNSTQPERNTNNLNIDPTKSRTKQKHENAMFGHFWFRGGGIWVFYKVVDWFYSISKNVEERRILIVYCASFPYVWLKIVREYYKKRHFTNNLENWCLKIIFLISILNNFEIDLNVTFI